MSLETQRDVFERLMTAIETMSDWTQGDRADWEDRWQKAQSPPVHVVEVFDRTDGIYVFADLDDAIAFEEAVNGDSDTTFESRCFRREEVICNHEDTLKLIESERENS